MRRRLGAHHIVRDAAYLNWRYAELAAAVRAVEDGDGWAVVTHAVWHGFSSAVICEAVGGPRVLRAGGELVDADSPSRWSIPARSAAISRAGFVPTPRTIRFIGKRLTDDAPELPKRRDAWSFTLGDLDFF